MGLITRIKDWNDGDILYQADLEAEFDNIINILLAATTTARGLSKLATLAEMVDGTSSEKASTPEGVAHKIENTDIDGGNF